MFLSLLDLLGRSGWPALSAMDEHRIEVADQGAELVVRARLDGIDRKSLHVQLSETALAIAGRGTREERYEAANRQSYSMSARSFYQTIPLPARVAPRLATMAWQSEAELVIVLPKA